MHRLTLTSILVIVVTRKLATVLHAATVAVLYRLG